MCSPLRDASQGKWTPCQLWYASVQYKYNKSLKSFSVISAMISTKQRFPVSCSAILCFGIYQMNLSELWDKQPMHL